MPNPHEQLEAVAEAYDRVGQEFAGPSPGEPFEIRDGGAVWRFGFKVRDNSYHARAKRLKAYARRLGDGSTPHFREARSASRFKVSMRRPGFSKKVYEGFIEDGEHENAEAYRALYDGRET